MIKRKLLQRVKKCFKLTLNWQFNIRNPFFFVFKFLCFSFTFFLLYSLSHSGYWQTFQSKITRIRKRFP